MRTILTPKLAVALLLAMSCHAEAAIEFIAGPNRGAIPQSWIHFSELPNVRMSEIYLEADQYGLHARTTAWNASTLGNPRPGAAIIVDDIIVTPSSGGLPAGTKTTISFGGHLSGVLTGNTGGGAELILGIGGLGTPSTSRSFGIILNANSGPTSYSDFLYTGPVEVTVGVPFRVSASLSVYAVATPGFTTIDFGDSFKFDPSSVFILEDGFTANSASWGLVNNQLAGQVPEPSTAAIFLGGLAAFAIYRVGRSGNRSRALG